jgi:hypothetical protein
MNTYPVFEKMFTAAYNRCREELGIVGKFM